MRKLRFGQLSDVFMVPHRTVRGRTVNGWAATWARALCHLPKGTCIISIPVFEALGAASSYLL